jgi:3-hydroxybutyryl-CoA dehydratase
VLLKVTNDTPSRALRIEDLAPGDTVAQTVVFDSEKRKAFSVLAHDRAPIHHRAGFAWEQGFDAPVIQGLAVTTRFSRLIGMYLPGEQAILQKVEFKYRRPVYADRELLFSCTVVRVLRPLGVVVLGLSVSLGGVDHVTGLSQCLVLPCR